MKDFFELESGVAVTQLACGEIGVPEVCTAVGGFVCVPPLPTEPGLE